MNEKLSILVISDDPLNTSGFGGVVRNLFGKLKKSYRTQYDILSIALYSGREKTDRSIDVALPIEGDEYGVSTFVSLKKQKHVFPELLINMVEAGEVSGNLDVIMERMSFHYEKENKINNKVKGAMAYPIILSIVAVVVVTFLLTFVMPTFVGMFESSGVELPLPTKILLSISECIKNYWYIHLLTLFVAIYGIIKYTKKTLKEMIFT